MKNYPVLPALFLFAVLAGISHADAAPGPLQPKVMVALYENGQLATGITEITYHCYGENTTSMAPSEQRLTVLNCSNGYCTNSGQWFNKLNPCFYFPGGFFSYQSDGKLVDSDTFSAERKDMQEISIDVGSGRILKQAGSNICFFTLILPALAGFVLVHRMV